MRLTQLSHPRVMAPGIRFIIDRNRRIKRLILDYSIGVAIVATLPLNLALALELKLLLTVGLIWKMMYDIYHIWGCPRWRSWALAGNLLSGLGALSAAVAAWLILFCISLVLPMLGNFTLAAALFTLTWSLGRNTHQFYLYAMTDKIDRAALKRVMKDSRREELL